MPTRRDSLKNRSRPPFHVSLDSARSRWVFTLIVLLLASSLGCQAAREWIATEFAESADPELWRRATQWEPGNAAYWSQLASKEKWGLELRGPEQAAADYERAVRANPYSDRDWLQLAGIYEERGELSRAQAAYETAQYDHPQSAAVAWSYGNFLLRRGNEGEACSQFRRALLADPRLARAAVAVWRESGLYTSQPIGKLLPPEPGYYLQGLDYFAERNDLDTALALWDELVKLGRDIQLAQALPFIDQLIFVGRVDDARRLWREALDASRWPHDVAEKSSLVFNGSFEQDLANGGFDWRTLDSPNVSFAFDAQVRRSGLRSLRLTFDGKSNLDFHHVFQYVAVEPEGRYHFEAYLKTSGVSTDSRLRFLLSDPLHPAEPQILTDGVTGTQPWTRVAVEFVAGPETTLMSITLRRPTSIKFDNKLAGTVWVDDVSLSALAHDDHRDKRRRQ